MQARKCVAKTGYGQVAENKCAPAKKENVRVKEWSINRDEETYKQKHKDTEWPIKQIRPLVKQSKG